MPSLVGVDKVAQVFGISERSVQRLVIYEGMPREDRGKYDLTRCMLWYIRYQHKQICGCAGPCEGFDAASRDVVNARAERRALLREMASQTAPKLVGLSAEEIVESLKEVISETFRSLG